MPHSRDPGVPPFFVVGPVRSGTTLLRLLIGHHPRICPCHEFEFVAPAIAGRPDWPELEAYRRSLVDRLDVRLGGIEVPRSSGSFPELAHELLLRLARADGVKQVGAVVHHHFDELPRVWPRARFIYLERDPRDVARSCVGMGWAGNAWAATSVWQAARDAWLRLKASLPPERFIEVRFEDLVRDAEAVLSRITAFLGLPYDPAMLEIESDTTYKRPRPGEAGSWRTESTEREIREMEARLGSELAAAGYEPSGLAPLRIGAAARLRLELGNRLGKIRFATRRYGIGLWAQAVVSRHLPVKAFRRRVQLQMDEIIERHLK